MGATLDKLTEDLKQAMRDRNQPKLDCIRMVKSRIMEKQVEMRGKQGADYVLSDAEETDVVSAYAKQRRDSIQQFEEAGRTEAAEKEKAELELLKAYLPEQLSEQAVRAIVSQAVADSGATSPKQMGAVMKLIMPQVKGKADGKLVNDIVKQLLSGG